MASQFHQLSVIPWGGLRAGGIGLSYVVLVVGHVGGFDGGGEANLIAAALEMRLAQGMGVANVVVKVGVELQSGDVLSSFTVVVLRCLSCDEAGPHLTGHSRLTAWQRVSLRRWHVPTFHSCDIRVALINLGRLLTRYLSLHSRVDVFLVHPRAKIKFWS